MNYQLITPRDPHLSVVEQVFKNRGMDSETLNEYLNVSANNLIPSEELTNMQEGIKMLISHINNKDKILVQVDSDCDGYTSAAFLINYLNRFFPGFVQNCLFYRMHDDKSHGLILETIPEDVKLVIAPDSSSNDYEVHQALKERGCDVLVIDHHIADHLSEYACVINNQMCDYPTKTLSGVGMVFKFCSYLDKLLGEEISNDYLDLAAIGIIGDVMDIRDLETRYIIQEGMESLRNPFLKEMAKLMDFKIQGHLNPFKVSFYIVPFINAINRSGTPEERLLVFESMLEYKAYEQIPSTKKGYKGQFETRVEQAARTCKNVKSRQQKIKDTNTEMVEEDIVKNHLLKHTLIAVKLKKEQSADKNLLGLIATQIANKYCHPTVILNETYHDGEKWWEGSMRGASHIPITDTRQMLLDTDLVEYCEGHANAAGVGIKDEYFDLLIENLDNQYKDIDFTPSYFVDLELPLTSNLADDVLSIARFEDYWGQGLEEPLVAITHVKITKDNIQLMKANTMKISFGELSFIKFRASDEEYDLLYPEMGYIEVTIIGNCKINDWNGTEYPQIQIVDYEINRRFKYDF